jgi:hypothetical protein
MLTMSNISTMLEEYFPYNKNYKKTNNSTSFSQIYDNINDGFDFVEKNKNNHFYKISVGNNNIFSNANDFNSIPTIIKQNIKNNLFNCLSFDFFLFGRKIKIYFILHDPITNKIIQKYTHFVYLMTSWLYIISTYSSYNCSQKLNIYIYLSDSIKKLPINKNIILNQEHINTAFTRLCSEIIIFRQEEWFKVFIHETIHNFNLDFSNMDMTQCNRIIKNIFYVNSNVNLYEAYTEFWARIINTAFISYTYSKNYNQFVKVFEKLLNVEISYSLFQMIKVLNYMDLTYDEIINNFQENYKEKTNVLSYFFITTILLFNYTEFLLWCDTNNNNLYDFKKTNKNLLEFCKFIKNKYDDTIFLQNIRKINIFFERYHNKNKNKNKNKNQNQKNKKINYLMNNLRMTIYELK